jgi:hypothetical protein
LGELVANVETKVEFNDSESLHSSSSPDRHPISSNFFGVARTYLRPNPSSVDFNSIMIVVMLKRKTDEFSQFDVADGHGHTTASARSSSKPKRGKMQLDSRPIQEPSGDAMPDFNLSNCLDLLDVWRRQQGESRPFLFSD